MSRPIFGQIPARNANPCIALFGKGPDCTTCKTCSHLLRVYYHNKTYLKCDLRKMAHSAQNDHRAKWDACGQYEKKEG